MSTYISGIKYTPGNLFKVVYMQGKKLLPYTHALVTYTFTETETHKKDF